MDQSDRIRIAAKVKAQQETLGAYDRLHNQVKSLDDAINTLRNGASGNLSERREVDRLTIVPKNGTTSIVVMMSYYNATDYTLAQALIEFFEKEKGRLKAAMDKINPDVNPDSI